MRPSKVVIALSLVLCAAALLIAGCEQATPSPAITLIPAAERTPSRFTDPELAEGEQQYNLLCAHCHGYNLEGQLDVTVPQSLNLGMHTVPSHDSNGHTWQHPDQLLIRVIREGIQNPLDQYPMPAFTDGVTDAQVQAMLRYIKLSWTDAEREHNRRVTEQWAEMDRLLGNTATDEPTPEITDESAQ